MVEQTQNDTAPGTTFQDRHADAFVGLFLESFISTFG
jgi:hypothetical protein